MSEETPDKILVWIPGFCGFNDQSLYDTETTREYEGQLEYQLEEERKQPAALQLNAEKIGDALWLATNWHTDEAHAIWAKDYAAGFEDAVWRLTDLSLGLDFVEVGGEIIAKADADMVRAFWVMSMLDRHQHFEKETGRSAPDAYTDLDPEDAGLLIKAVLDKRNLWEDLRERMIYWMCEETPWHVWQKIVDWDKFEEGLAEKRQELIEELPPEERPDALPERCPWTPDLIAALQDLRRESTQHPVVSAVLEARENADA